MLLLNSYNSFQAYSTQAVDPHYISNKSGSIPVTHNLKV